ncbi:glucose 1-dehydrogenase [Sphingobium phenoxybenzoativorans]|uniref:Glucose 1-dehydrogenase n=2 Tax=Sphingobium phenoxybenzoativorans TaxID=1592790 RepID=A0A975KDD1_9SPHN|nr:glucose 1-dehydrogenase [Sphingobium phenoxybenzoativorans]
MRQLSGKIALVTGGSTGIGRATAERFAEEGATVYIFARNKKDLEAAASEIGHGVIAVAGDVTKTGDLKRLVDRIKSGHGRLDIVVANAGTVKSETLAEATEETFDETLGTNLRGVYFTVSNALPLISKGGSVVLTSSGLGYASFPGYGPYSASKAAVQSLARTWALELAERGIRVNTVSPGPIETPIIDKQVKPPVTGEQLRENFAQLVPMKRIGEAQEVAAAVLFLASDESSYISGIDIPVDGALLASL